MSDQRTPTRSPRPDQADTSPIGANQLPAHADIASVQESAATFRKRLPKNIRRGSFAAHAKARALRDVALEHPQSFLTASHVALVRLLLTDSHFLQVLDETAQHQQQVQQRTQQNRGAGMGGGSSGSDGTSMHNIGFKGLGRHLVRCGTFLGVLPELLCNAVKGEDVTATSFMRGNTLRPLLVDCVMRAQIVPNCCSNISIVPQVSGENHHSAATTGEEVFVGERELAQLLGPTLEALLLPCCGERLVVPSLPGDETTLSRCDAAVKAFVECLSATEFVKAASDNITSWCGNEMTTCPGSETQAVISARSPLLAVLRSMEQVRQLYDKRPSGGGSRSAPESNSSSSHAARGGGVDLPALLGGIIVLRYVSPFLFTVVASRSAEYLPPAVKTLITGERAGEESTQIVSSSIMLFAKVIQKIVNGSEFQPFEQRGELVAYNAIIVKHRDTFRERLVALSVYSDVTDNNNGGNSTAGVRAAHAGLEFGVASKVQCSERHHRRAPSHKSGMRGYDGWSGTRREDASRASTAASDATPSGRASPMSVATADDFNTVAPLPSSIATGDRLPQQCPHTAASMGVLCAYITTHIAYFLPLLVADRPPLAQKLNDVVFDALYPPPSAEAWRGVDGCASTATQYTKILNIIQSRWYPTFAATSGTDDSATSLRPSSARTVPAHVDPLLMTPGSEHPSRPASGTSTPAPQGGRSTPLPLASPRPEKDANEPATATQEEADGSAPPQSATTTTVDPTVKELLRATSFSRPSADPLNPHLPNVYVTGYRWAAQPTPGTKDSATARMHTGSPDGGPERLPVVMIHWGSTSLAQDPVGLDLSAARLIARLHPLLYNSYEFDVAGEASSAASTDSSVLDKIATTFNRYYIVLCFRTKPQLPPNSGAFASSLFPQTNSTPDFDQIKYLFTALLPYKFRKGLAGIVVLRPPLWMKALTKFFSPFVSEKFWAKLHYADSIENLWSSLAGVGHGDTIEKAPTATSGSSAASPATALPYGKQASSCTPIGRTLPPVPAEVAASELFPLIGTAFPKPDHEAAPPVPTVMARRVQGVLDTLTGLLSACLLSLDGPLGCSAVVDGHGVGGVLPPKESQQHQTAPGGRNTEKRRGSFLRKTGTPTSPAGGQAPSSPAAALLDNQSSDIQQLSSYATFDDFLATTEPIPDGSRDELKRARKTPSPVKRQQQDVAAIRTTRLREEDDEMLLVRVAARATITHSLKMLTTKRPSVLPPTYSFGAAYRLVLVLIKGVEFPVLADVFGRAFTHETKVALRAAVTSALATRAKNSVQQTGGAEPVEAREQQPAQQSASQSTTGGFFSRFKKNKPAEANPPAGTGGQDGAQQQLSSSSNNIDGIPILPPLQPPAPDVVDAPFLAAVLNRSAVVQTTTRLLVVLLTNGCHRCAATVTINRMFDDVLTSVRATAAPSYSIGRAGSSDGGALEAAAVVEDLDAEAGKLMATASMGRSIAGKKFGAKLEDMLRLHASESSDAGGAFDDASTTGNSLQEELDLVAIGPRHSEYDDTEAALIRVYLRIQQLVAARGIIAAWCGMELADDTTASEVGSDGQEPETTAGKAVNEEAGEKEEQGTKQDEGETSPRTPRPNERCHSDEQMGRLKKLAALHKQQRDLENDLSGMVYGYAALAVSCFP